MKRVLTCILTVVMALSLSVPAFADLMWEPMDNPFYEAHGAGCRYESRNYYANGKEGFVTAWDAPGGSVVRGQYENGTELWVGYTYGDDWALISVWEGGREFSGWIPLADLELVYDYQCFEEEYADRIADYHEEFAGYEGNAETVNFYEYPGAPEISQSFDISAASGWGGDILGNLTGSGENSSYISRIFVDEDGRTWGFVNYMYGRLNSWFCLAEPDGEDFPVREVPAPDLVPARAPTLPTQSYIPYILVAVVVGATAGILVFFYGKKRKLKR